MRNASATGDVEWLIRVGGAHADAVQGVAVAGDRIAIASYLGKGDAFDCAIADFSAVYADQNERDYDTLVHAVNSGRISAQTGV